MQSPRVGLNDALRFVLAGFPHLDLLPLSVLAEELEGLMRELRGRALALAAAILAPLPVHGAAQGTLASLKNEAASHAETSLLRFDREAQPLLWVIRHVAFPSVGRSCLGDHPSTNLSRPAGVG